LPPGVLRHFELEKGSSKNWTIALLRTMFFKYFTACERASQSKKEFVKSEKQFNKNKIKGFQREVMQIVID